VLFVVEKENCPRAGASLLTTNNTNWTNGEGNWGRMAIQVFVPFVLFVVEKGNHPQCLPSLSCHDETDSVFVFLVSAYGSGSCPER
jgi:hypothetical protein